MSRRRQIKTSTDCSFSKSFAESLSYLQYPRPFKNPEYTKGAQRRTRNLKAVLTQERERERVERERRRAEREEAEAKRVSDEIDQNIREERAALRKKKKPVKVLLLGQSESGKSTTLKSTSHCDLQAHCLTQPFHTQIFS